MLQRGSKLSSCLSELVQSLRLQHAQGSAIAHPHRAAVACSSLHSGSRSYLDNHITPSQELAKRSCHAAQPSGSCSTEMPEVFSRRPFSASAQASASPAQSPSNKQKPQQLRSPSGHKQRKSPFPPQIPPDDSPSRFRPPDHQASLAQLLKSQADGGRSGMQEREVVVTPRGKKVYQQPQNKPAAPWTPTRLLGKRKVYTKRMGFLMQELEKEKEAEAMRQKNYPSFGPGSVLELTLAVPENKNKPATVKGLCIAKKNRGFRTSFTLLNHLGTYGQVERIFPLYCPSIKGIKVQEHRHVRRAKLYYLRDRNPREYRIN